MDDSTIESENASDSADYDFNDSDDASNDSASDDSRSLPERYYRLEPTHVISRSPSPDRPEVVEEEPKEENPSFLKASKKDKKKLRAAAQGAVFD